MKYTILIPGGFKPPHRGHYDFIKYYLENPEVDKVIVFSGDNEREGITLSMTEDVFREYGLLNHHKFIFRAAKKRESNNERFSNPMTDCYEFAEENKEEPIALGVSTKDRKYAKSFEKYFQKKQGNIVSLPPFQEVRKMSSTLFRKEIRRGVSIISFLPEHVEEESIIKILNKKT